MRTFIHGRLLSLFLLVLLASVVFASDDTDSADAPSTSPLEALSEGNLLFRNGQIEAAVEAYQRGYGASHAPPTLAYNLGTALHHLGRLPEAILWYRRAGEIDDPWLQNNLALARTTLGGQVLPPAGLVGTLLARLPQLRRLAIFLAWATLLALLADSRLPRWIAFAVALAALSSWGTAAALERWGPRPAILLAPCATPAGELPVGTEAWVRPAAERGWALAAGEGRITCPGDTLELVFP